MQLLTVLRFFNLYPVEGGYLERFFHLTLLFSPKYIERKPISI